MNKIKREFTLTQIRYLILIAIIALLAVIFGLTTNSFLSVGTVMNFLRQNAVLAIAAMGMLLVMLTGGLDLSVGSTGAFAGMAAALAVSSMGADNPASGAIGILVVLLVGLVVGSINGWLIGYVGISPFMTTLGMQIICRGATIAIAGNARIVVTDPLLCFLGGKRINIPWGDSAMKIPVSIFAVLFFGILTYLLLRRFSFGRKLFAVGGNRAAAICSGINAKRITMLSYMLCSLYMSVASIIWLGRNSSAVPLQGSNFEFDVLTAVILGGCSLAGGIGTLAGTLLGVAVLGVITIGLNMLETLAFANYLIQGGLILISVIIDTRINYQAAGRLKLNKRAENVAIAAGREAYAYVQSNKQRELRLRGISKAFPGVQALNSVDLTIRRGEVHAIMGENGAGKSTLMKILSGVYTMDSGSIQIDEIPVDINNPVEARKLGISIIYQEFALIPEMTIAQNVFLGKEEMKGRLPLVDQKRMRKKSEELLNVFDMHTNVDTKVGDCMVGQQQMIEIAKAVGDNAWVVIMDEPTGAITEEDKNKLFRIIEELKKKNVAIIYISHRMSEVFEIADRVTVLRDGKHVISAPIEEMNEDKLITYMVGRELVGIFNRGKAEIGDVVLEVRNLSRRDVFDSISFQVRAGEVLGFSGLIGAGRTEIMRCLFGLDHRTTGEIFLDGKELKIHSPVDAIREGICMVSEDRQRESVIPLMSVAENIELPSLRKLSTMGWVDNEQAAELSAEYIRSLNVKTPSPNQLLGNLSGGNQQKVCLAKWLAMHPRVIIMDEPTRGIDVGAKAEIVKLIERMAKEGIAIIMISSEMPELIGVSDRIIVLCEGKKTGEFQVDDTLTQEQLMSCAMGIV